MDATAPQGIRLLDSIADFCRRERMAESTFGRRAVNDGKFVARLREGARITPETLQKVSAFLASNGVKAPREPEELWPLVRVVDKPPRQAAGSEMNGAPERNFRFFDNRQKYLLFVNTCSEKEVIARRVGMELAHIHPQPPAVRVFDAGMGDGTVLARVMREMHRRFPTIPFAITGKEISLEDVRLTLDKMADRFHEHPATVLAVTNMYYSEAPWLSPKSVSAATSLVWHEVALTGTTSDEFGQQIAALEPFLARNWQVTARRRAIPSTSAPSFSFSIVTTSASSWTTSFHAGVARVPTTTWSLPPSPTAPALRSNSRRARSLPRSPVR
jgi:hypothetical protein